MELQPNHFNQTQHKIAAALLSGSLLVGNVALAGRAFAESPPPAALAPQPTIGQPYVRDIGKLVAHHIQQEVVNDRPALRSEHRQTVKPKPVTDATNAFTPDWWRCVIRPESSGNFDDESGGFGILDSTWRAYGMSGVPGDYPRDVQARVALRIYHANGGFGPSAWNNSANCGKDG